MSVYRTQVTFGVERFNLLVLSRDPLEILVILARAIAEK